MNRYVAQASPSNAGASRSADFQPPTGNPQTVPGQLFPDAPSLQNQTADEILQDNNATIEVLSNPSSSRPQVTEAKSSDWFIWLLVLVVAGGVALVTWLRRRNVEKAVVVGAPSLAEPIAIAVKKSETPKPRKPAPKKSKSQRKKRAKRS